MTFIAILFWFSLIFIIYTYGLYPLIIFCLAAIKKRKPLKGCIIPHVSFLVIAHNEEGVINDKIKNCLELDYPSDKIEFVFVSSGSTDNTPKIIASYSERRVKLIVLNENRGKSFAINQVVPELNGEIVLFSDARQIFNSNCVRELVNNFNDPSIGAVSGELMLSTIRENKPIKGINLYWSYEKFLREKESSVYSTLGATGAIYAIRKELFEPIPDDTVLDDFVIPINVVKRGYRVVFERNAKAWDSVTETHGKEFERKTRTLSGNYQAISNNLYLFNYKTNPVFFQLISHKFFRLLVPFFFLMLLITNVLLEGFGYRCFLVLQIIAYLFSVIGLKYNYGIFGLLGTFIVMNCASVVGLYRFLTRELDPSWKTSQQIERKYRRSLYRLLPASLVFAILLVGVIFSYIYSSNHSYTKLMELFFWLTVLIAFYTYIGYPCIILLLSLIIGKKIRKVDIEPMVSIIITAYNEENKISQKIENSLLLDYPKDKLEIIVASDGSTDSTNEIVRKYTDRGVQLIYVEGRVGKTETQNKAIKITKGEIIVFSDAASMYKKDAIRKLVRNFTNSEIGGVCGKCQYIEPEKGGQTSIPTKLYWWYETLLKKTQTHIGVITGASGLIYAIRKELYFPLPPHIISDMVEPMMIVKKNKRFVYEPEAIAYEETTTDFRREFNMRVRVISRGMVGIFYSRKLLNPFKYGWISFQLFSHKILRWFIPLYLIGIFMTNAFLISENFYLHLFVIQNIFYLSAILSFYLQNQSKRNVVLDFFAYICVLAAASFVALFKVLEGKQSIVWSTDR